MKCSKCPALANSIIYLFLGITAGTVAVCIFARLVMEGAGSDRLTGAVQKILLNYIQLIGSIGSVPAKWPFFAEQTMKLTGAISTLGEHLFPVDCLLPTGMRPLFVKQLIIVCLPLLCIGGFAFFWSMKRYLHERRKRLSGPAQIQHIKVPEIIKMRHEERLASFKMGIRAEFEVKRLKKDLFNMSSAGFLETERLHSKKVNDLTKLLHLTQQNETSKFNVMAKEGIDMDAQANAIMHARDIMDYVHKQHIDLHDLWQKYDKEGDGEIATAQFYQILKTFGFEWTNEEFNAVLFLFDGENQDGFVNLSSLVQFGRTYHEKFILTCTTLFVLLYPTVVKNFFQLVACEGGMYDGGSSWTRYNMNDLSIVCYESLHLKYVLYVGIPNFFLYVVGLPILMLFLIKKAMASTKDMNSKESHDSIRYRYGLLMAGFRDNMYAWEFVINSRKAFMVLVTTVGSIVGPDGQLYFAILFLGLFVVLQVSFRPYRTEFLNRLELVGLLIIFFSMYFATTYFYQKWGGNANVILGTAIGILAVQFAYVFYCIELLIQDNLCCKQKKQGVRFLLEKTKKQKKKTHVQPRSLIKMAVNATASTLKQKQKREAQINLREAVCALKTAKTDERSMAKAKLCIENAAQTAEDAGIFVKEKKALLVVASRAMFRAEQIATTRAKLIKIEKFKASSLQPMFPSGTAGWNPDKAKKNAPPSGCIEVMECLLAMTGIEHHSENGLTHEDDPVDRWLLLCVDMRDRIRDGTIDKEIRKLNPLSIPNDVVDACVLRLADMHEDIEQNVACATLLPWMLACLSMKKEHEEDVALMLGQEDSERCNSSKIGQKEERMS